jgi:hypothetical protein
MPRTTTKIRTSQPPPPMNTYTNHYPQVQITKPQLQSSFLGTMAEGFSFGVGSSVARHAVDSIFSSKPTFTTPPQLPEPDDKSIEKMAKLYKECMDKATNFEETEKCEKFSIQRESSR